MVAGTFARTGQDLFLLDSIVRQADAATTSFGSVANNVSCATDANSIPSLQGVRLGLPSSFGWNTTGINLYPASLSAEVWPTPQPYKPYKP